MYKQYQQSTPHHTTRDSHVTAEAHNMMDTVHEITEHHDADTDNVSAMVTNKTTTTTTNGSLVTCSSTSPQSRSTCAALTPEYFAGALPAHISTECNKRPLSTSSTSSGASSVSSLPRHQRKKHAGMRNSGTCDVDSSEGGRNTNGYECNGYDADEVTGAMDEEHDNTLEEPEYGANNADDAINVERCVSNSSGTPTDQSEMTVASTNSGASRVDRLSVASDMSVVSTTSVVSAMSVDIESSVTDVESPTGIDHDVVPEHQTSETIEDVANSNQTTRPPYLRRNSQLENIVYEILHTERIYVEDLKQVIQGYKLNLTSIVQSDSRLAGKFNLDVLFGNIQEIYDFNRKFLEDLESCDADPALIAECFVQNSVGFVIYTQYCTNYPSSMQLMNGLLQEQEISCMFVELQHQMSHHLPVGAYLLKPVQRILKYHLLLESLLRQFDSDDSCYKSLSAALTRMTGVAQHINEMKRKHEHSVRIHEIQSLLCGWNDGENLANYGDLVMEDSFKISGARGMRQLILLDKILLITKKRDDGGLDVKTSIHCSNLMLVESISGEPLSFHVIPFNNPKHQTTVQCRNLEQKKSWCVELKRLILESYTSVIPDNVKQLVMTLGKSKEEQTYQDCPYEFNTNRKQSHSTPQYLEKRMRRRKSTTILPDFGLLKGYRGDKTTANKQKHGAGAVSPPVIEHPLPATRLQDSDESLQGHRRVTKVTSYDDAGHRAPCVRGIFQNASDTRHDDVTGNCNGTSRRRELRRSASDTQASTRYHSLKHAAHHRQVVNDRVPSIPTTDVAGHDATDFFAMSSSRQKSLVSPLEKHSFSVPPDHWITHLTSQPAQQRTRLRKSSSYSVLHSGSADDLLAGDQQCTHSVCQLYRKTLSSSSLGGSSADHVSMVHHHSRQVSFSEASTMSSTSHVGDSSAANDDLYTSSRSVGQASADTADSSDVWSRIVDVSGDVEVGISGVPYDDVFYEQCVDGAAAADDDDDTHSLAGYTKKTNFVYLLARSYSNRIKTKGRNVIRRQHSKGDRDSPGRFEEQSTAVQNGNLASLMKINQLGGASIGARIAANSPVDTSGTYTLPRKKRNRSANTSTRPNLIKSDLKDNDSYQHDDVYPFSVDNNTADQQDDSSLFFYEQRLAEALEQDLEDANFNDDSSHEDDANMLEQLENNQQHSSRSIQETIAKIESSLQPKPLTKVEVKCHEKSLAIKDILRSLEEQMSYRLPKDNAILLDTDSSVPLKSIPDRTRELIECAALTRIRQDSLAIGDDESRDCDDDVTTTKRGWVKQVVESLQCDASDCTNSNDTSTANCTDSNVTTTTTITTTTEVTDRTATATTDTNTAPLTCNVEEAVLTNTCVQLLTEHNQPHQTSESDC